MFSWVPALFQITGTYWQEDSCFHVLVLYVSDLTALSIARMQRQFTCLLTDEQIEVSYTHNGLILKKKVKFHG